MNTLHFYAPCPLGLEELLAEELRQMGIGSARSSGAGATFEGDMGDAYRACLWSRIASRVLLPLDSFPASSADELYDGVRSLSWEEHMRPDGTLWVDFTGTSLGIIHTQFGAQRVKDAIADRFRDRFGYRPSVDRTDPDMRIHVFLRAEQATISIDLSGESLHRRGYRTDGMEAPLKENLAAAILIRAGWPSMAEEGHPLLDPLCGSGTLLTEAAWISAGIAPGLQRRRFGFERWRNHRPDLWRKLLEEARERRRSGLSGPVQPISGFDSDPRAIEAARRNLEQAGVAARVRLSVRDLSRLEPTPGYETGLLVTNPPYGERLGHASSLAELYRYLGLRLREQFSGWRAAIFTGNPDLCMGMGLRASKAWSMHNGALPCRLLLFDVNPERFMDRPPQETSRPADASSGRPPMSAARELSPGATMFANRIRKNLRTTGKWARRNGIEAYRLYDGDIKEYALAVDLYGAWAHVQEYAAPTTIDPQKAEAHLREALDALPDVLQIPRERIVLKRRERQRGKNQYGRMGDRGSFLEVREGPARLLVNLTDYLDTGLFLDHRPLRRKIRELAEGRRFLNLFCYTATATVQAALGGASRTHSVDLSTTYLEWASRNLAANGLAENRHSLERADCLDWLQEQRPGGWDLILLDPPTFSNSKRMLDVLDVQRDHVALIRGAHRLLSPGGRLFFSTNLRRFRLDSEALSDLNIQDITPSTLDPDFARNPRIHFCFEIAR